MIRHPILLSSVFVLLAATVGMAQEYRLQAGDRVRILLPGLPDGDWVAEVDMGGLLDFPYLGTVDSAGRTIGEVRDDLALAASGREIPVYGMDGSRSEILLRPSDIFVTIDAYKPVTVSGAVADPGTVEYAPGLTARAAIASAGGPGRGSGREVTELEGIVLLENNDTLTLEEAQRIADLWRLDSILAEELEELAEAPRAAIVERLGEDYVDRLQDRIALDLTVQDRSTARIDEQLELYDQRIGYLERTLAGHEEVARLENEELERVQSLFERNIVSMDRLSNARSSGMTTNIRVLDTEALLAEARIERGTLAEQLNAGVSATRSRILADRAAAYADLVDIEERMERARDKIDTAGLSTLLRPEERSTLQVVVYRRVGGRVEEVIVALDDTLLPGDVLDVILEPRTSSR